MNDLSQSEKNTQNKPTKPQTIKVLALILIVGVAAFAGAFVQKNYDTKQISAINSIREGAAGYKFINPLLAVENELAFNENKTLEKRISDLIKSETNQTITSTSVYYRYFGQAKWVGINENQKYNPASMLKVVVMIAYLKKSEENPDILNQSYTYNGENPNVPFELQSDLKVGSIYTVNDLIEKMIEQSDNGAMSLLIAKIDPNVLSQVYTDLGIENPDNAPEGYLISAKTYSLFFRILYNATYLNRTLSERALDILSKATFKDGLVAGVPEGSTVAHKYGEHIDSVDGQISDVELHDCGVIYATSKPYFLCVMTRGSKVEDLTKLIKDISKLVYDVTSKN